MGGGWLMSETAASRDVLAPYCTGIGLDMGFGGDAVVPTAITFDMPQPYTHVGGDPQTLRGDCRDLSFICDDALDYVYSAHLLEDFTYHELVGILSEWRRVLKLGGLLVTNCPDQQKFLAHCAATGQGLNAAHKEADFGLETFKRVLTYVGAWEDVYVDPAHGAYSWLLVVRKV